MTPLQTLWISADNDFTIGPVTVEASGSALTSGTCTYALKDTTGASVGTGTLSHVSAGTYRGVMESTVSLTENATYYLEITFTESPYNDFRRIACIARYRTLE